MSDEKKELKIEITIGWLRNNRCWSVEVEGRTIGSSLLSDMGFHDVGSAIISCLEDFREVFDHNKTNYFFGNAKDYLK